MAAMATAPVAPTTSAHATIGSTARQRGPTRTVPAALARSESPTFLSTAFIGLQHATWPFL